MSPRVPILACFMFCLCSLTAQNLYNLSVGELKTILDTIAFNRELKVQVCNELAYKLKDIQTDSAKYYAGEAIEVADAMGYDLGKSYGQVTLGLISKREKDIELAEDYFLKALSIRTKITSDQDIASVYNNLGLLFERNNSIKAKKYYELGLNTLKGSPLSSIKAVLHNNYGNFLTQEKNLEKALRHLDSSLTIRRSRGNENALGNSYLNLASYFYEINDTSQFEIYLDSSLLIFNASNDKLGRAKNHNLIGKYYFSNRKFDAARESFELAITLSAGSARNKYRFLRNLAAVEIRDGELGRALDIIQECLTYFEEVGDDREVASLLINLGTIFYEQANYSKAIENYQNAIDKLKSINDIDLESQALLFLSASYGYTGELQKAAHLGVQYLQLSELYHEEKTNSLNFILDSKDLLVQNAEFKVKEITDELELEKERIEKMRNYMILGGGIIFFLFLLAAAIAAIYRQKKRIADLKIDDLLADNERETHYARLEEQESVRNRIAMDLHDRLGSMFTAIKFSLGDVESTLSNIKEENKQHYDKVNRLVDEACDEVRNIAHDLKNSTLANFGLKIALESLAESFNGKDLKIVLQIHNLDSRLSNRIEVNVYQIVQELISNTLKHAKANKLTIQLNRFGDLLNITVEDDGIGFVRKNTKMGMGLNNIETRVYGLDGKFNLDSGKGVGTTVMIDIPLPSNNN